MAHVDDIRRQIHDYVVSNLLFEDGDVDDAASLRDAGILDSMGVLEMVLFVEESLNVPVDDTDVRPEHFDSINGLTDFVLLRMSSRRDTAS